MEYSSVFVCLMGMGTVFFGLICLILLTEIMGRIFGREQQPSAAVSAPASTASTPAEPNRQELVAAVSAAIAEELGTDISGIRILSMKKLSK